MSVRLSVSKPAMSNIYDFCNSAGALRMCMNASEEGFSEGSVIPKCVQAAATICPVKTVTSKSTHPLTSFLGSFVKENRPSRVRKWPKVP